MASATDKKTISDVLSPIKRRGSDGSVCKAMMSYPIENIGFDAEFLPETMFPSMMQDVSPNKLKFLIGVLTNLNSAATYLHIKKITQLQE